LYAHFDGQDNWFSGGCDLIGMETIAVGSWLFQGLELINTRRIQTQMDSIVGLARQQRFERIVARALDGLPPDVVAMLDNVHVIVENEPTADQIAQARAAAGLDGPPAGDEDSLFGLYEGVPLTQRGGAYHLVPPDRITIFRGPLERACASPQAIAREVRITVMHELGHHLGFEEDRLEALGLG
jgi:predicted Zn-dependent protease with MMP-like domain